MVTLEFITVSADPSPPFGSGSRKSAVTHRFFPFNVDGIEAKRLMSTAWLFKIASHRMLSVAKQSPVLPATDIGWKNTFRRIIYEVIHNRRYVDGVIVLVRGIYESCRQLGVDFKDVELGDWLMFQQVEKEYPVRNITPRLRVLDNYDRL